jgi:CRISPR system Cascade subunit CasD
LVGDAVHEFLLFRLYGLLVSWGSIAVGERRDSWNRPSKSAILGLIAAALGIERHDNARHNAFAVGYGFAVKVDTVGSSLRDFHTVQTTRKTDIKNIYKADTQPLTRRRELSVGTPETICSQREYYTDALYTVALWAREAAPVSLIDLRSALLRPRFALYLGRKSCPLSLPLGPEVITANDLLAALASYRPPEPTGLQGPLSAILNSKNTPVLLAWEDFVFPTSRLRPLHMERRRDSSSNRVRWHFTERDEHVAILK